jgi:phosphoglycolate phosphatase
MKRESGNTKVDFPIAVKMILVDLDGTMIDTAPDIAASANRMLEDLGRRAHDPKTVTSWIGNGVSRLVKRALTGEMHAEPEKALYERAHVLFLEHYSTELTRRSRPFPGVVEGLEQLQFAGFELVCITNKAGVFTLPLLHALDLEKYFRLVLSGDSLPKKKPDPLPLLHACEQFGISPDHGLLVGDSSNDIQAARAAGMPVICVSYGYNHGHDIRDTHPDAAIESLVELPNYLRLYQ